MAMCFVPNCLHKTGVHKCQMYSFPRSPRKNLKWAKLIRRGMDSPTKFSRVCSCHLKGHPKQVSPTEFPWNKKKLFSFRSPEKKRRSTAKAFTVRRCLDSAFDGESKMASAEEDVPCNHGLGHGRQPSCQGLSDNLGNKKGLSLSVPLQGLEEDTLSSPSFALESFDVEISGSGQPVSQSPANFSVTSADSQVEVQLPNQAESEVEVTLDIGIHNDCEVDVEHLKSENARMQNEIEGLRKQLFKSMAVVHEAENTLLRGENQRLKEVLEKSKDVFLFSKISHSDDLVRHYTGMPNKETFYALLKLCSSVEIQYFKKWKVVKLDYERQLFLTLLKLRRDFSNLDLSVRFNVGRTTVSNIFVSWVLLLHHVLVDGIMSTIPSRQKNQTNIPDCFSAYPHTRMIIDCTEVTTANPNLLSNQNKMFSSYKHRITSKALVGIAPNGTVTFVSKLFPGSTSDRSVVIESGILNSFMPGDSVMADKGFNIADIMPDGVALNITPFKEVPQFTKEQLQQTYEIARARVHVERAIARIKNFKILDFIPQYFLSYASEIFRVCAALTNLQNPLIDMDDSSNE